MGVREIETYITLGVRNTDACNFGRERDTETRNGREADRDTGPYNIGRERQRQAKETVTQGVSQTDALTVYFTFTAFPRRYMTEQ